MEISLFVSKADVYEEVAQTTSYTGAKMQDSDPKAFDRVFTTEADRSQLERFWTESRIATCEALKKYLYSETQDESGFRLVLSVSSAFDVTLRESMERELFSFFVTSITAKWFVLANKQEAKDYAVSAASYLDGVKRKACFKKRPVRPRY